jgi:hypothetical protein
MAFSSTLPEGVLDSNIIIRAVPHSGHENIGEVYLLFKIRRETVGEGMYWVWEPVGFPQRLVGESRWEIDAEEGQPHSYWHYRFATHASEASPYHNTMTRGKKHIALKGLGVVYEWTMDKANTILPGTYYHCCNGKDVSKEWCFKAGYPLVTARPSLPVHVLHTFMETAIQKEETCPVSMDTLTRENIAYTKCGHLFTHEAIMQCIAASGTCPNCRGRLEKEDVCGW